MNLVSSQKKRLGEEGRTGDFGRAGFTAAESVGASAVRNGVEQVQMGLSSAGREIPRSKAVSRDSGVKNASE